MDEERKKEIRAKMAKTFQAGRARFHLFDYLQDHPDATNEELIRYIERKNGRLVELRTKKDDDLCAPLPPSWKEAFEERNIPYVEGEYWETALSKFPKLVMPCLSRAKRQAKEARVKYALYNWPEIIEQHKKQRKR